MTIRIDAADLFCGAGGTSTGLLDAVESLGYQVDLLAVNHWEMAIATHEENHPGVKHFNSDLQDIDPRTVIPGGKLTLLVASPECTHFSRARGGRPVNKQSRASVKYVLRWIGALDIENVLIENVAEFKDWGPLHRVGPDTGKPIKKRKGEFFNRFINKLQAHGYMVSHRILNAADYGDATTRRRLFILARKGKAIIWPEPTHSQHGTDMFATRPRWRPAREIIDWSLQGESIFERKKPLSINTLKRIQAGLKKYGGRAFVLGQQSGAAPRDVDQPIPTVAGAGAISLIEPFIITTEWGETNRSQARSTDQHVPTITGQSRIGLVQPFVVALEHTGANGEQVRSIDDPLQTISASAQFGLAQPFLIEYHGTNASGRERTRSVDEPLPTVDTSNRFGLVQPFIVPVNHGEGDLRSYDIEKPMPTITSVDAWGLVQPFLVMFNGTDEGKLESSSKSVDEPLPTIVSANHAGLVEPFLVEYHGTGGPSSIDEPIKTQTSKDRFALVQPQIFEHGDKRYVMDIRFRMLQPHELASAMSFPSTYKFRGNREQVVKQIGNAVPVRLATELCKALLS